MSDEYEFRRFELEQTSSGQHADVVRQYFQPLGDDGWEVINITEPRYRDGSPVLSGGAGGNIVRWVDIRHAVAGAQGPTSWEYTAFDTYGMPDQWRDHIASRGWSSVGWAWYNYWVNTVYVYKRSDVWRGTDDGDILGALRHHGFEVNRWEMQLPWRPDVWKRTRNDIVSQILDVKWRMSEAAHADVGTWAAVERWCAEQ
jgi:hypothetical protein